MKNLTAPELTDLLAFSLSFTLDQKQQILDTYPAKERITLLLDFVQKAGDKIWPNARAAGHSLSAQPSQSIQNEDMQEIAGRLEKAELPPTVQAVADRELKRLKQMHSSQAEYTVVRSYLEWLADLPWKKSSTDVLNLKHAQHVLDEGLNIKLNMFTPALGHFGMTKVKKRIVEYLAVNKLQPNIQGPIICLVGPPGVVGFRNFLYDLHCYRIRAKRVLERALR